VSKKSTCYRATREGGGSSVVFGTKERKKSQLLSATRSTDVTSLPESISETPPSQATACKEGPYSFRREEGKNDRPPRDLER